MKISEASDIKLGTSSVSKVMLGTTKVWPNEHLLYGEIVTQELGLPAVTLDGTEITPIFNELTNTFYLDSWPVTSPTSFGFTNEQNIKTITKLKGIDTSNVKHMYRMFGGGASITSLDLSNFNTSSAIDMDQMFEGCQTLTSLDLSNFNTSNVKTMVYMFHDCPSLTSLNLSNFDINNVTDHGNMFLGCRSLTDVYINVEATLNKLTNNLTSQGANYIPSKATIHYNDVDYKWNGSAWTQQ